MAATLITNDEPHSSNESPPPPQPMTINPRASFSNPSLSTAPKINKPQLPFAPRVDVEPIYTQLKGLISEHWQLYKQTIAEFVLGRRNQSEMCWILDPFMRGDAQKESLHNQLIMAILINSRRDAPELPGVASWVLASDKPRMDTKSVTGDLADQRLKSEIMQLPSRERYRIKHLIEDNVDKVTEKVLAESQALRTNVPDPQVGGASAGGLTKTNWEGEIQKHYTQQLFAESSVFPDAASISNRILPICYEHGIFHGFAPGTAEFMVHATEIFTKDLLSRLFSTARTNGPHWVKTAAYKRRLLREETACQHGHVRRNANGKLPVEVEAEKNRQPLGLKDLQLAIKLEATSVWRGHTPHTMRFFEISEAYDDVAMMLDEPGPVIADKDTASNEQKEQDNNQRHQQKKNKSGQTNGSIAAPPQPLTNGVGLSNGLHNDDDTGWIGGSARHRTELNSVLDDCLAGL